MNLEIKNNQEFIEEILNKDNYLNFDIHEINTIDKHNFHKINLSIYEGYNNIEELFNNENIKEIKENRINIVFEEFEETSILYFIKYHFILDKKNIENINSDKNVHIIIIGTYSVENYNNSYDGNFSGSIYVFLEDNQKVINLTNKETEKDIIDNIKKKLIYITSDIEFLNKHNFNISELNEELMGLNRNILIKNEEKL